MIGDFGHPCKKHVTSIDILKGSANVVSAVRVRMTAHDVARPDHVYYRKEATKDLF